MTMTMNSQQQHVASNLADGYVRAHLYGDPGTVADYVARHDGEPCSWPGSMGAITIAPYMPWSVTTMTPMVQAWVTWLLLPHADRDRTPAPR